MKWFIATWVGICFGLAHVAQAEDAVKTSTTKEEKKAMHEQLKDEREATNAACVTEAKEANCGDKTVGKGLLKCIREHKKASKDFKISEGCKSAMKALREEKQRVKK